ncbi:MAG: hypothetical protein LBF22_02540, partial [Deltaproteobacteria bacterium]|nr:hypothetical protein [Deltaproteobacteria bacterium]
MDNKSDHNFNLPEDLINILNRPICVQTLLKELEKDEDGYLKFLNDLGISNDGENFDPYDTPSIASEILKLDSGI